MGGSPRLPSLTRGRRSPKGTFLCSAEGEGLPGWFPPFWIAYNDQSDPENGVHCSRVPLGAGAAARRLLTLAGELGL